MRMASTRQRTDKSRWCRVRYGSLRTCARRGLIESLLSVDYGAPPVIVARSGALRTAEHSCSSVIQIGACCPPHPSSPIIDEGRDRIVPPAPGVLTNVPRMEYRPRLCGTARSHARARTDSPRCSGCDLARGLRVGNAAPPTGGPRAGYRASARSRSLLREHGRVSARTRTAAGGRGRAACPAAAVELVGG